MLIINLFPFCLDRLLDPQTNTEIANYPIYKILFCVRGHDGTAESDCFAFTESHYNAELFRIHVFRCEIQEAVSLLFCFILRQDSLCTFGCPGTDFIDQAGFKRDQIEMRFHHYLCCCKSHRAGRWLSE